MNSGSETTSKITLSRSIRRSADRIAGGFAIAAVNLSMLALIEPLEHLIWADHRHSRRVLLLLRPRGQHQPLELLPADGRREPVEGASRQRQCALLHPPHSPPLLMPMLVSPFWPLLPPCSAGGQLRPEPQPLVRTPDSRDGDQEDQRPVPAHYRR